MPGLSLMRFCECCYANLPVSLLQTMSALHAIGQIYITNVGAVILWKYHAVTVNTLEVHI
jgi:hypothetical protein